MTRNQRKWWYGLLAGFFGGMWTSIDSGLAVMIIAPKEFNLDEGLSKTLWTMLILGVLAGAKVSVAFLKQSPLPPMNGDTELFNKPTDMKLILALTIALGLAYLKTHAAETAAEVKPLKAELFNAGEIQLDLNGTASGRTFDDVSYGGGIGLNYYHWRNLGFGADLQTEDTASSAIDRIGVNSVLRFPIEKLRLAPEVRGGYQFDFEHGDQHGPKGQNITRNGHELYVGGGAEWRLGKTWGIGAEVRHVWPLDTDHFENYLLGILRVRKTF